MSPHHADGARRVIDHLGLEPHPEGGWYRRTWTAPASSEVDGDGPGPGRAFGSSILYLVESGQPSRWHRIDSSELWQHAAGAPVRLSRWAGDASAVQPGAIQPGAIQPSAIQPSAIQPSAIQPSAIQLDTIGPDLFDGETPQVVVDPGVWQSARTLGSWSLVACVVVPEFRFDSFELAPDNWSPPA